MAIPDVGIGEKHACVTRGHLPAALSLRYLSAALLAASSLLMAGRINAQISLPSVGSIATVAGDGYFGYTGDGGPATDAELEGAGAVAVDTFGNIFVNDDHSMVVRKISAATGIITTIAGNGTTGYSGDGGPATSAQLNAPWGLAVDSAGNFYIADANDSVVRKVSTSGIITTVAGNGSGGYGGDGGAATNAALNGPGGIALDSAGNLYISDSGNNVIRKVSVATGIISTVAGNGTAGYSGDGGLATSAELNAPGRIAVDSSGNLYIADYSNNVVRKVTPSGTITTVAGNGTAGYSGDGGPATNAELDGPNDVAVDSRGNIAIVDTNNNVIRLVTASTGNITTIAGNGTAGSSGDGGPATNAQFHMPLGIAVDSAGNIYIGDYNNDKVRAVGSALAVTSTTTPTITWNAPAAITYGTALSAMQLDATASVEGTFTYFPAQGTVPTAGAQSLSVVFTPTDTTHYNAVIATVALTVNPATPIITWTNPAPITYGAALSSTQLDATANVPGTLVYTPALGTVLGAGQQTLSATFTPTDTVDYTSAVATVILPVSTVPSAGIVTTVAGNGNFGFTGDGGMAVDAAIANPNAIAVDAAGNIYFDDWHHNVIRKVSASTGIISTFAGNGTQGYSGDGGPATSAELNMPGGMAIDTAGDFYFADSGNNVVRKVTPEGVISTVVGTGASGYSGDNGPATSATLASPWGLAIDSAGNLYIADRKNEIIRKVAASTDIITTVAGTGATGYTGDNGPAVDATFNTPSCVAIDTADNLYILDTLNDVVRKVTASTGTITTVVGNGTVGYTGDGGLATNAEVNLDGGIAIDLAGNLLVVDSNNNVVREVNASTGIIATVAGNGTAGYSGDGGPATSAQLNQPEDVAVDSAGNFYIADDLNDRIREVGSTVVVSVAISVSPSSASLYAGKTQQFTATVTNTSNTAVTWSISPAGTGTIDSSGNYTAPATLSTQKTVTVTAISQADTTKSASAVVTLQPANSDSMLTLSAAIPPPYVVGASEQFSATLKNRDGSPLSGTSVAFTVTGANAVSGTATTNNNGVAAFAYTGANSGNDTVQATANIEGTQVTSNSLRASWIVPAHPISTTTVAARFFPLYAGCCDFSATPANTPVFSETFPTINFNPPSGSIPGNNSIGVGTAPFTDVTLDSNGNYSGTIVAQGNGYQAFIGSLRAFQVEFAGSFIVADTGDQVITVFVDNAFTMGIGGGATAVTWSGGGVTAFNQYPVMGALSTSIGGTSFTVHFPGPGTYPYELDYVEDGIGDVSLMMMAGPTGSNGLAPGIPSTGTLTLAPSSVQAQPVGGQQTFTAVATNATGNPVPNLSAGLVVTQDDYEQISKTTDSTGMATFTYTNTGPGTDQVQAVAIIDGMVTYSNQVDVPWTSSSGTGTGSGSSGTLNVSASAPDTVVLPNALALSGTATDSGLPSGDTISTTWSEVSGPGTVSFADAQQLSTTASFDTPGTYELELTASDVNGSASAQIQVTVDPAPGTTQGWIGSPANGSEVSGVVPITVASGVTLASGTLTYYPASNPNAITTLNADTTGSSQIGMLDTTTLPNGAYWITLDATTTSGATQYNLIMVTVTGNNKPGRVTTTVTDLVVPVNGLSIKIQRTYDSLYSNTVGDFGYGWRLGTSVDLTVGPMGNVTFTLNGRRKTFDLAPQFGGWFLPYYFPAFTPEPGLYGTLTASGPGCPDLFDFLVPDGNLWACIGGGFYTPPGYIYTDPSGTSYTISANGTLQSIMDKNGNMLTITADGITGSSGLNVTFARDAQGRIDSITDPQGNLYQYSYDANGNLASVTYPNTPTASTYTYDANHLYLSGTDFNGNPLPTVTYYTQSDTDPNGLPLNGRLESVSDALGEKTSYAYNLATNTTTVTYPPDASGNVGTATMVYDSYGDLVSETDPLGHTTTDQYDANHNLISVADPMGNVTSYTYDANGNRQCTTYPKTATSTNTTSCTLYNQFSEPTQTEDELGSLRYFNYDINYSPVSVTDSLGTLASFIFNPNGTMQDGAVGYDISADPSKASQFTYDANGNMTSRTDALGRTTTYSYNSLGQKTSMTAPAQTAGGSGATTGYQYDAFGNLTETDAPLGRTTKSAYDGNGNKISDTDALGNVTHYKYDALNRLIETNYPDSTSDSKNYDFRGNVIDEKDQAGHVTHHVYDLAGRLTSVTYAYGTADASTVSYTYDNDGRKLSATDSLGHATNYTYDAAGNLLSVSGVKGNFTYTYDDARNRVSMTDGDGNKTTYVYDARKRLTETDYPDGTKKTYTYDGPGNLTLATDQAGNQVQYSYDAANQLTGVVELNSPNTGQNTTIYGYDGDGNPITFEDANSHATSQSFDLLNELSTQTLPDGSLKETRTYDASGNLKTVTHFNGTVTTYTYDSLNRLLSRSTPGEPTVSFTYTATGKRATMTDASGTTTYNYDNMDRLTSKQTPEGTLSYTYDAAGNLASIASSNANGASMSYTYDSLNRLSTVVNSRLGTTTYTYDGASNVGTVTYPNGVEAQYQYDALNRVTGLATQQSGFVYQRGPTGNLTNASELNGRQVAWSFDGIYRLTGEAISSDPTANNNGSASYDLDPVGNRLSDTSSLAAVLSGSWSYNADDELGDETYDQDGNVTAAGGKSFSYDSQNELVAMNGGAVQIMYDGDGNQVAKSVTANGVTSIAYYLVDNLNPTGLPQVMDDLDGSGVVTRTYTYGLERISEDQIVNNTWMPSFYSYDGMGSVRQLTNINGQVTDSYEYDAFGNEISHTGTTPNNYLYRGEQWDPDLGLYYLRARYYNPLTGRFMSRDPNAGNKWESKSFHAYLYANGDPVNAVDPIGRDTIETLFTTVDISSALETNAAFVARTVTTALCTAAKDIAWSTQSVPPGIPAPWGGPLWPYKPAAILCAAFGY